MALPSDREPGGAERSAQPVAGALPPAAAMEDAQALVERCSGLGTRCVVLGLFLLIAGTAIWVAWPPPLEHKTFHMLAVVAAPMFGAIYLFTGRLIRTTGQRGGDALAGPARELVLTLSL